MAALGWRWSLVRLVKAESEKRRVDSFLAADAGLGVGSACARSREQMGVTPGFET